MNQLLLTNIVSVSSEWVPGGWKASQKISPVLWWTTLILSHDQRNTNLLLLLCYCTDGMIVNVPAPFRRPLTSGWGNSHWTFYAPLSASKFALLPNGLDVGCITSRGPYLTSALKWWILQNKWCFHCRSTLDFPYTAGKILRVDALIVSQEDYQDFLHACLNRLCAHSPADDLLGG